jgi:hypothetical protein
MAMWLPGNREPLFLGEPSRMAAARARASRVIGGGGRSRWLVAFEEREDFGGEAQADAGDGGEFLRG